MAEEKKQEEHGQQGITGEKNREKHERRGTEQDVVVSEK